jgi:hypothetical protein
VGRQAHAELAQRSQHLARDALGAAPDWPEPDPFAAEIGQRLDPIRIAPEEDQRFCPAEPTDELQPVTGRPLHPILDEGELGGAYGLGGDQPRDVLD